MQSCCSLQQWTSHAHTCSRLSINSQEGTGFPREVMTELALPWRVGAKRERMREENVRAEGTSTQCPASAVSLPLMSVSLGKVKRKLYFLECLCRSL